MKVITAKETRAKMKPTEEKILNALDFMVNSFNQKVKRVEGMDVDSIEFLVETPGAAREIARDRLLAMLKNAGYKVALKTKGAKDQRFIEIYCVEW